MRLALLAIALCACLDARAGTTGLSTDKARTAAPSAVNLSGVAAAEGSSLAFCRADHTHGISGVTPVANGGTGASTGGVGPYVQLQASTPGTVQSGNLNVSGFVVSGQLLSGLITSTTNVMVPPSGGFMESVDQVSGWFPQPSPTTSTLIAEAALNISSPSSVTIDAAGGNAHLGVATGDVRLSSVDGNLTMQSTVSGTTTIGSGSGGLSLSAGAAGAGTLTLAAAAVTYNTAATSGTGIPAVFGAYTSAADETGSKGDTTLRATSTAPGAGLYRIAVYVMSNNTCATPGPGAVTVGMKWTDPSGVQKTIAAIPMDVNGSATLATSLPLGNTTGWANASFPVFANASTSIIFNTTLTACTSGTAKYRVYVGMDKPT